MADDSWKGETWWMAESDCPGCGSSNTSTNGRTLKCLDCDGSWDA